ncbi:MAG: pyruvate formate lyase-activating protein [Clostridia bacterium]|nr:pyruvate formate lyase-activating protein [Clostridia bacterium]
MSKIKGYIHSIQSLGTVDGPGVRFVVFMQGCPLRCSCCHNPDTWEYEKGTEYTPDTLIEKAERYVSYFGNQGGITLSGGEPLIQSDFALSVFKLAHKKGINTCLDTSGCVLNDSAISLLDECDRVLLDIKYINNTDYKKYVGCSIDAPMEFLKVLNDKKIATTIRQVIIPTINDNVKNAEKLLEIAKAHSCVDKIELLPFRKMCQVKYENLGIEFPFQNIPSPDNEKMAELNEVIREYK